MSQTCDKMNPQSTQPLCHILDGIMRNTREGRESIQVDATAGIRERITRREGSMGDSSEGAPEDPLRRQRDLGL